MVSERPLNRLPLRDVLAQASRLMHEIAEFANKTYQNGVTDLHELSRPARKKSHFPTVVALENGLIHYEANGKELDRLLASLEDHIKVIREQGNRARNERT